MKAPAQSATRVFVPLFLALMLSLPAGAQPSSSAFPGEDWETRSPEAVGLDPAKLDAIRDYAEGRGCVVRHGYLVYTWGDYADAGDVASAVKPWISHFLFKAVEDGRLASLDTKVCDFEPRLAEINADLDYKDRAMTFRHLAFQTACYGLADAPGTAFDYNDWQMALLFDTLFLKVYGATHDTVDANVLHPMLTDPMQCQDSPSFLAFGQDRPGRLAVSPRDFARFGLLYLHRGNWNGHQLISKEHAVMAVTSPLPNTIPRTSAGAVEMIEGQRSIGSRKIPDNQCDHCGSYSWLWWVNGVDAEGKRNWPDAPSNTFAALGHGDMRGMAVLPGVDLIISWNDSKLGERPLNEVFRLLCEAAEDAPRYGQVMADPDNPAWLVYNRDRNADGSLDPCMLCGPGDPEGFLYLGERQPDGTRSGGSQEAIIGRMSGTGANCLYIQAIRSHGGDGDTTHNPFVDSDPATGVDEVILKQWDGWLTKMDEGGIVPIFFLYDDATRIWDTGDSVGPGEQAFIETLVKRLAHHNLIWCVAEEYQERFSPERVKAIAAIIRAADEHNHPVAVHKLDGLDFNEFADDPNIDQFAVQYNQTDADALHNGLVDAWNRARGRYNLNLSEAADFGAGNEARRKMWAAAMAGAHCMALGWTFDEGAPPSRADLEACGHLVRFFEATDFNRMAPHDELRLSATRYVLANPGGSYIACSTDSEGPIGLHNMAQGQYDLLWCDPVTGATVRQEDVPVDAGDAAWPRPGTMGREAAVWIKKVAGP